MFRSSIGRKALMAVTGFGLVVYVIAHMVGNLQVFQGREALNAYAAALKGMPKLLWTARIGLLAIFLIHVYLGVKLYAENRAAREAGETQGFPPTVVPGAGRPARGTGPAAAA